MSGISPNANEKVFCTKYILNKNAKQAVMLVGPWGCGKTWFLVHELAPHIKSTTGRQVLHISVAGAEAPSDVMAHIAESAIHWFQKPSVVAKMIGGLLGPSADVAELSGLPGAKVAKEAAEQIGATASDWMRDICIKKILEPDKVVLVFDDIERCLMPPKVLFGFINHFVEERGIKCLLVCNEDKAFSADRDTFKEIKEKVIGASVRIRADIQLFLDLIIDQCLSDISKKFLVGHRRDLLQMLSFEKEPNLRSIRAGISNFSYVDEIVVGELIGVRGKKAEDLERFRNLVLRSMMACTIESRSGEYKAKDIAGCVGNHLLFVLADRDGSDEGKKIKELSRRVMEYYFENSDLGSVPAFVPEIIDRGLLDQKLIIESAMASIPKDLSKEEQAIGHLMTDQILSFDDKSARDAIEICSYLIENGSIRSVEQFVQLSMRLYSAALNGLYAAEAADVEKLIFAAVDKTDFDIPDDWDEGRRSAFSDIESRVLQKICAKANDKLKSRAAGEVAQLLAEKGALAVIKRMSDKEYHGFSKPLLQGLSAIDFWSKYLALSNHDKNEFRGHFSFRYRYGAHFGIPQGERSWLIAGKAWLDQNAPPRGSTSFFLVKDILAMIDDIISKNR